MDKTKLKKGAFNRRDFLITLGAGSSLAIAGFFTFDAITGAKNEQVNEQTVKPLLSELIQKTLENNQLVLSNEKSKCTVNKTGEQVIELLDGNHTLSQVAATIAGYYAIEHTELLDASIASFICQLGEQGFLAKPFYVTMYETYA